MRWKSVFSYYGGKSKIADVYPAPRHDLIIEPFAGAAAYSFRYRDRQVWLNDLDDRVASIWEFLLSPDAADWVERYWPATVRAGATSADYLPDNRPDGLVELFRAEANQGTQGARGVHEQVTSMGEKCWGRTKGKLLEIIPTISHWKFTRRDYEQISNLRACWFIDPPYANAAGQRYRESSVDYGKLGSYASTRNGQVIVCENSGATWLDFRPLNHRRVSIRSRYQRADAREVMFYREGADPEPAPAGDCQGVLI
jgi:hypothetical protein